MTKRNIVSFNPLDKRHLGESVGQAMLRRPCCPLGDLSRFRGAGIYAIYYSGDLDVYQPLATLNRDGQCHAPIYVGKAVPKGARKGSDVDLKPGNVLFNRLRQHAGSIEQATNLNIHDFSCRYIIVDDVWIPLGESLLIAKFDPLWNKLVDGFGNHDPGSGRLKGLQPRWDTIHPGRAWAERCQARGESADDISREVREYLKNNPPQSDPWLITN